MITHNLPISLEKSEFVTYSLPRCAISKRFRYEKQIKALHFFRLLSLEMLHRRVKIEKQDFRKESLKKGGCELHLQVITDNHNQESKITS